MSPTIQTPDILHVRLVAPGQHVKLAELKEVAQQLQQTLSAVETNLAHDGEAAIGYAIVEAEVGSLTLGLQPVAPEGAPVDPSEVVSIFASDLVGIRYQSYRPSLTPGLAKRYLSLVRSLSGSGTAVEYAYRDQQVTVDSSFRQGFEIALRERVAEDVVVTGLLEAVNAHREPFRFSLYPKLPRAEAVDCRFPREMLSAIAELLKLKAIVRVSGRGYFLPIGSYPSRLEVREQPVPMPFDPELLRSYIHRLNLVPAGLTVQEYLRRNREAAGLAEQD